jgi:Mg2+-importing ATPase
VGIVPFDHERRCVSVLVDHDDQRLIITKGAPEAVFERCTDVSVEARQVLEGEFAAGNRVVAIATRPAGQLSTIAPEDEHELSLDGFLVFLDQPRPSAAASIARLAELGITVKIVTGDNPLVAETVCRTLGMHAGATLTGGELDQIDDDALPAAVQRTTIFARVSPEQKARILRAQRESGSAVAFLGDGVNDALALHHADVGISVDSATDVAKDAADIILLARDLDVIADGVAEGRRIFANTIKYVLMGTSSNFGNMFSVTVAAAFLPFLPMLPFQILLNNLLYDTSQMTIPTDRVDPEQLARPSHWDIGFIRRFMVRFGPISSVFDFATFAVLLRVFDARAPEFRSGWFVESLGTQTLIVFAIRTRRVPFLCSRPSWPLTVSVLTVVAVGAFLPQSPFSDTLGFAPLPLSFFAVLAAFVVGYLVCVEAAKCAFYRTQATTRPRPLQRARPHRVHRIAAPWSHHRPLPAPTGPSA